MLGALAVAVVAAGCAGPGGRFDQAEGCRNQLTSFNGAGDALLAGGGRWDQGHFSRATVTATNFTGRNAAAPAGLEAGLAQENADLDALQIAFDALLYCRWIEARTIRAELAANRVPRPAADSRMAALRARLQRDLARAQQVLDGLERR
ncbi:hypothetical protein, partial [Neoroseomonas soli]